MRIADPRVVRLHDAGAELRVDLLGLGDADHSQPVQALQPLLRVVNRGVGMRGHQNPDVGIARNQLAHGLDDRGRLAGSGWALHQLHAAREKVDGAAHRLLLAGVEALVEGLQVAQARGQHLVGRNQEGGHPPQADVARREAVEGPLLDLNDGCDRLRPDRARPQRPFLAELDQPAPGSTLAA